MADTEFNKSALNKIVDNAVKKLIKEAQPRFDRPRRDHKGKPAVEIEPHVRAMLSRLGWKPGPSRVGA